MRRSAHADAARALAGRTAALLLAFLAPAAAAPAVAGELYGLVVGIDAYSTLQPLEAAARDARDIADSLRRAGARSVRVLIDDAATRAALRTAWRSLLDEARPGDTLVFSFAGHGGQEIERVPGSERDGRDEVLLLGGFSESGPGTAERIVDDELGAWFEGARHLNVIFVADSCHSGTLTRAFDARVRVLGSRFARYGPIKDDALVLPKSPGPPSDERAQAHVTYLAAVADGELAPELLIDGEPRGALSWAFARALEGHADGDDDGWLTNVEIRDYVVEAVRAVAESRQHPQVLPRGSQATPLVALAEPDRAPADPENPATSSEPLRLAVLGTDPAGWADRLDGVVAVGHGVPADLILDVVRREVISGHGDVVARLSEVSPDSVQPLIDRWRLLGDLRRLADGRSHGMTMRVEPGDGLHHDGATIRFVLRGHRHPHVTLLNLPPNGGVELIYPADPGTTLPPLLPMAIPATVGAPFGAEHLIAVATPEAAHDLQQAARSGDVPGLRRAVARALQSDVQIAALGVYTAP